MNWQQFEATAPDLAGSWKGQLDDPGVALIQYGDGRQSVMLWPRQKRFSRPYG